MRVLRWHSNGKPTNNYTKAAALDESDNRQPSTLGTSMGTVFEGTERGEKNTEPLG